MKLLKDKVAIITGAGSGIGRETALLFAENGARLGLFDISIKSLNSVKDEAEKNGTQVIGVDVDITNPHMVKNSMKIVAKQYGNIDIVVNVAGIFIPGSIEETSEENWEKVLDINLNGTFLCTKYAIQEMKKTGGGSIINISSEAGLVGISGQVAYNVSKAAVISLTKSTAVDYAQENIRVNCICPGRVLTPLVKQIIDNDADPVKKFEELSFDRPQMRMGDPKDIAYACLMLACDRMSYATGAVLSIDGGYTAR